MLGFGALLLEVLDSTTVQEVCDYLRVHDVRNDLMNERTDE